MPDAPQNGQSLAQEVATTFEATVRENYGSGQPTAGWNMPVAAQKKLFNAALKIDPEELRFFLAVFHQFLLSTSQAIELADLPDVIESFAATNPEYKTVGTTGGVNLEIRPIEIPLVYSHETLEDKGRIGVSADDFIAKMQSELGNKIVYAVNWAAFNGVLQNANFAANEPQNSNIGLLELLRTNAPSRVVTEKRAGSGHISVGPNQKVTFNKAAAVDKGAGLVGIGCTNHEFPVGSMVKIEGTANYDGKHLVDAATTADELVIATAFVAENITPAMSATWLTDFKNLSLLADFILELPNFWPAASAAKDFLSVVVNRTMISQSHKTGKEIHGDDPLRDAAEDKEKKERINNMDTFALGSFPKGKMLLSIPGRLTYGFSENKTIRKVKDDLDKRGLINYFKYHRGYGVQDANTCALVENIIFSKIKE